MRIRSIVGVEGFDRGVLVEGVGKFEAFLNLVALAVQAIYCLLGQGLDLGRAHVATLAAAFNDVGFRRSESDAHQGDVNDKDATTDIVHVRDEEHEHNDSDGREEAHHPVAKFRARSESWRERGEAANKVSAVCGVVPELGQGGWERKSQVHGKGFGVDEHDPEEGAAAQDQEEDPLGRLDDAADLGATHLHVHALGRDCYDHCLDGLPCDF